MIYYNKNKGKAIKAQFGNEGMTSETKTQEVNDFSISAELKKYLANDEYKNDPRRSWATDKPSVITADTRTSWQKKDDEERTKRLNNTQIKVKDMPLVYLNDPLKIVGDFVKGFKPNRNPFPTSDQDAKNIAMSDEFGKTVKGIPTRQERAYKEYLPSAVMNVVMGVSTPKLTVGNVVNETLNPLAVGPSKAIQKKAVVSNVVSEKSSNPIKKTIKNIGVGVLNKIYKDPKKATKVANNTNALFREVVGYSLNNKKNKAAVKEGKDWLDEWTSHPATQARIDDAFDRRRPFNYQFDINRAFENKIKQGIKKHSPKVGEYSMKQHFTDFPNKNIHVGNNGISMTHGKPYGQWVRNGTPIPTPTLSYTSRSYKIPQDKRTLTTIHEGVHDWFKNSAFRTSGLFDELKNMYSKRDRKLLDIWEKERASGLDPGSANSTLNQVDAYRAYISNPTEVHARIMELRKQYGIKPDTEITDELILGIAKDYKNWKITGTNYLTNIIDNDLGKLKKLFKILPVGAGVAGLGLKQMNSGEKDFNNNNNKLRTGGLLYKNKL